MTQTPVGECTNCGKQVVFERRNYRYSESGIPNVVLQGVAVADCLACGNSDVAIPRLALIHRAIARALANSPARLTGPQLRFLRKHLGLSGEELGRYLHTDKTKISKWETEQDRIGPPTDRLIRLLAMALDEQSLPQVAVVAEYLPQILDQPGSDWELHLDAGTLQFSFCRCHQAA